MKYGSKAELVADIEAEYDRLAARLADIPERRYGEPGVWGDDWTVNDLIAHLAEWHRLFLGWHRTGVSGGAPAMPAPGYTWNETPRLNRAIRQKHAGRPTAELRAELEASHAGVLALARDLPADALMEPGRFAWTGTNTVATYLAANTASHYRFAMKVLNRWQRGTGTS